MPLHIETPLVESRPLSLASGRTVRLKLEALQPPGSFKIRGIGAACEHHARRGVRRFVSSSGGNAGIAVAHAGRRLSAAVVVVVPETASAIARRSIEDEGAELVLHGAAWHEAHALALTMVDTDTAFVHPFDDPLVWRGHATMIDEAVRQGARPDAVVLSVGGGGLLCGVVEGLRRNGWSDVPVVAVETRGAESLHRSMRSGRRVTLDAVTSIATSLGAREVCEQAFRWTSEHPVASVVVDDAAAVSACLRFVDDHRLVVEPASGAALAPVYDRAPELDAFDDVLVVVCGGAVASLARLDAWAVDLGARR